MRGAAGPSDEEFIMAFVRVEQRNAHLAGAVRLHTVEGRDGPISKATLTAISNTRKGSGENRGEEATAIQWTLWGKQADNAALYLGKGSHVNVVGRVQNNNYERDGETVYTMAFTAEEIDYLDTRAEGEALRAQQGPEPEDGNPAPQSKPTSSAKAGKGRKAAAKAPAAEDADDIPF
jgi:single stranded DNA-binding protein